MSILVGIAGVSGYGGGELLRYCAGHPSFDVVYAAGESTAGQKLVDRYPAISPKLGELVIQKWDAATLPKLDLLFASLPTGHSRAALADVPKGVKIVDVGGDHRYVDSWVYGLADVWPEKIRSATRVANPGCFPATALAAIAPLVAGGVAGEASIIINALTGVSGTGRGAGDSKYGYSEVNEDSYAYGLLKHVHIPEMEATVNQLSKTKNAKIVFTPHLVPMTRGILATCYLSGTATTEQCLAAARKFYAARPFVRVVDQPPHTKWTTGSNLVFVSYASAGNGTIVAMGAADNLGKGAAGQAVQNANLMFGFAETAGLEGMPVWP